MTTPTPEQLRQAAAHLARAVAETDTKRILAAMNDAVAVWWPDSNDSTYPANHPYHESLRMLNNYSWWHYEDPGTRYLAEALRWRLLLTALWQEQPVLDTNRADSWRDMLAWREAWQTVVEELLAGTSPAPAAGE